MVETIIMPIGILPEDFLTIFVSSTLVLVFGGFYVGIYTAVKVKILKSWAMPFGYIFWLLTGYCMYLMGSLMHIDPFTAKAFVIAEIGLLLLPHAVYYMQHQVHLENED